MPGSRDNNKMPDMSSVLESVLSNMPGMEELPAAEKKKMKKAIRATTEKVQSLDLEGIFKDAMEPDNNKKNDVPPPPPEQLVKKDRHRESSKHSSSKKPKKQKVPKQRTADKQYSINLSLEELYLGKTSKKLTVRVNRKTELTEDDRKTYLEHEGEEAPENAYKYASQKIKHSISERLEPGMMDDDIIVFEKEADEEENHITGDIVATIVQDQHPLFERENNDLWILNKKISLAQSYYGGYKFAHLDGRLIEIVPALGEPLHSEGGLRRIPNAGMKIREEEDDEEDDGAVEDPDSPGKPKPEYGDLYIQFELELPETISEEHKEVLHGIFPEPEEEVDPNTKALLESGEESSKKTVEKVEDNWGGDYGDSDEEDDDDDDEEESDSETEQTDESEEDDLVESDNSENSDTESETIADQAALELLMEEAKSNGEEFDLDTIQKQLKGMKN